MSCRFLRGPCIYEIAAACSHGLVKQVQLNTVMQLFVHNISRSTHLRCVILGKRGFNAVAHIAFLL